MPSVSLEVDEAVLPGSDVIKPVSGSRYLGRGVAEPDDVEDIFESAVVLPFAPYPLDSFDGILDGVVPG